MGRLAVDIGGTFTDLVCFDNDTGELVVEKALTTPRDLTEGVQETIRLAEVAPEATTFFVHGVPETAAIWDRVRGLVGRDSTALRLPGFGAPRPDGHDGSMDAHLDWLVEQVLAADGPVDVVGHDWGGILVARLATYAPAGLRSWVSDAPGAVDRSFEWHDVAKVWRSMLDPGKDHYKYIDLPLSNYGSASFDKIVHKGKTVGALMFAGYSYNERSMLSLGIVDPNVQLGDEVTLVWGEPDGGTKKVTVERHKQLNVRATVSAVPYSKFVRETYAAGWRTGT